jgi:GNAT superfamily N-acetyltransferase
MLSEMRTWIRLLETETDDFLRRWNADVMPTLSRYLHVYLKPIDDHQIELETIMVERDHQGEGLGTTALNELTRLADEIGVSIVLYPEPTAGPQYYERLERYYERFGFVSWSDESMVYEPAEPVE